MDLHLTGKRALVTGASGGIGAGIARALAAEGAHVAVHGRDRDRTEAVVAAIRGAGGTVHAVTGDLRDDGQAEGVFRRVEDALGGMDILVNNAGVYLPSTWDTAEARGWAELYEANVVSAVRLARLAAPGMRERGWGRILNCGSGEAQQPLAQMPEYAATKAALANLTVSLAKHLAGSGVTANLISPGVIATDGLRTFFGRVAEERGWADPADWPAVERRVVAEWAPNTVGRLGTVEEVASFFAYLASPHAGFINGSVLRIDGGFVGAVM